MDVKGGGFLNLGNDQRQLLTTSEKGLPTRSNRCRVVQGT